MKVSIGPVSRSAGGTVAGLVVAGLGVAAAFAAHWLVPQFGVLTWAVALGIVAANLRLVPAVARPGLHRAGKRLLRLGVVLLGFALPLGLVAALGPAVILLVVGCLLATLALTYRLGLRLGLGRPRSLLIATGFSICGASAIAAMEEVAEADEDDVAVAIAMVTLCGTAAMIALPLLREPFGLTGVQLGVWAGASVHEVGQVVAAAGPAGASAVAIAMAVKLTRVLLLAPVVAAVSLLRRRGLGGDGCGGAAGPLPPVIPLFVAGFVACSLIRTAGLVPAPLLPPLQAVQTVALGAALFGLGTGVHLGALLQGSRAALVLSTASTLAIGGAALVGVLALV